jgi:hypothetical protein
VLATAAGLAFTGTSEGELLALDAATCKELLSKLLGGPIHAPIIDLPDVRSNLPWFLDERSW